MSNIIRAKEAKQIIFQRQIEAGLTWITLTTSTTTKLVINTTAFMTLGTDDL